MPFRRSQRNRSALSRVTATYDSAVNAFRLASEATVASPLSRDSWASVHKAVVSGQADPCGDGDQSPIPDEGVSGSSRAIDIMQQPMRKAWASGLDLYHFLHDKETLHVMCYYGNVEGVRNCIAAAQEKVKGGDNEAMKKTVEERMSMMRLTPLHMACTGARTLGCNLLKSEGRYVKIVRMLLEAGARPNAREILGLTPVANAAAFVSTAESCLLVPLLVKYGADVNIKTRFGEGFLPPTIMRYNRGAFRALVHAGVDLDHADRTGLTSRKMASHPVLLAYIFEAEQWRAVSKTLCDFCGKAAAKSKCGQCLEENYCCRECQMMDWRKGHKKRCVKKE